MLWLLMFMGRGGEGARGEVVETTSNEDGEDGEDVEGLLGVGHCFGQGRAWGYLKATSKLILQLLPGMG